MSAIFNLITDQQILKIYDRIDINTVQNINKLQDKRSYTRNEINIRSITREGHIFDSDFNNQAEFITFPDNIKYVKIYLPLNIFTQEDIVDLKKKEIPFPNKKGYGIDQKDAQNKLITAYERGLKNRDTVSVYINGEKIPDKAVLLTVYQGSLDIYFQEDLLDDKNEICFITRTYTHSKPFQNFTWVGKRNLNGYNLEQKNTYSLFMNGIYLVYNEDYTIDKSGNLLVSDNIMVEEDDVFEIIKENNDIYSLKQSINTNRPFLDLTKLYCEEKKLQTEHLPTSKNIITVYVNGRRICNDDLEILNGCLMKIKEFDWVDDDINFNLYYLVKVNYNEKELKTLDYQDGLMKIMNLYDEEIITRMLNNKYLDVEFLKVVPDFLNENTMRNIFPINYKENLIKNPIKLHETRRNFAFNSTSYYITNNNYYLKHFLKEFNEPENVVREIYVENVDNYLTTSTTNTSDGQIFEFVTPKFCLSHKYDKTKTFIEKIFLNGMLINRDKYVVMNNELNGITFYYINGELIKNGDTIKLVIEESSDRVARVQKITLEEETLDYKIDTEGLNLDIFKYDTIPVYVKTKGIKRRLEYKEDFSFYINQSNSLILRILNKRIFDKYIELFVANPYVVNRYDIKFHESAKEINKRLIKLSELLFNDDIDDCLIKDTNNLEIYYKGYRLNENTDFIFTYPSIHNSNKGYNIIINIQIEKEESLVFVFKNRRHTLLSYEDRIKSKYGLLYLPNIYEVFDHDYIKVYLNNVLLGKDDINILTNNLIQIKNKEIYRYYSVYSEVNLPHEIISFFHSISTGSSSNYELFFDSLIKDSIPLDKIYELIKYKKIDESLIIPEQSTDDEDMTGINVPKNDLRLDLLYEEFYKGKIDKLIDCNKGIRERDLENLIYEYFNSNIINLNANQPLKLRMGLMDTSENYYSIIDIAELFGKYNNEIIDGEIDDFEVHPMDAFIYQEQPIILDSNKNVHQNDYIYDANQEDVEEVIIMNFND